MMEIVIIGWMNEEMLMPIIYGAGAALATFLLIFVLFKNKKTQKPEMEITAATSETRHGDGVRKPVNVSEGIYDTDQSGYSSEEEAKPGDSVNKVNQFDD